LVEEGFLGRREALGDSGRNIADDDRLHEIGFFGKVGRVKSFCDGPRGVFARSVRISICRSAYLAVRASVGRSSRRKIGAGGKDGRRLTGFAIISVEQ
jgi:hypothetical protein